MHGKITSFNEHSKQGVVTADDGTRYSFSEANWQGAYLPKIGDNVEFTLSATHDISSMALSQPSHQGQTVPLNAQHATHSNEDLYSKEANYNMIDWFMKCMRNYATFKGRARRKEYWYFYLVYIILAIIAAVIDFVIFKATGEDLEIVANILSLALFLPTFAVGARRLHDIGKSGWWQLIGIVPIVIWVFMMVLSPNIAMIVIGGLITLIAWILLIVWLATETKPEVNRFGVPAKPM